MGKLPGIPQDLWPHYVRNLPIFEIFDTWVLRLVLNFWSLFIENFSVLRLGKWKKVYESVYLGFQGTRPIMRCFIGALPFDIFGSPGLLGCQG